MCISKKNNLISIDRHKTNTRLWAVLYDSNKVIAEMIKESVQQKMDSVINKLPIN